MGMAVLEDLIRAIELWLRIAKEQVPLVDPTVDPVLLVPGIGCSILEAVDEAGNKEKMCVRILAADHEFRAKLWSKFDASTDNLQNGLLFTVAENALKSMLVRLATRYKIVMVQEAGADPQGMPSGPRHTLGPAETFACRRLDPRMPVRLPPPSLLTPPRLPSPVSPTAVLFKLTLSG